MPSIGIVRRRSTDIQKHSAEPACGGWRSYSPGETKDAELLCFHVSVFRLGAWAKARDDAIRGNEDLGQTFDNTIQLRAGEFSNVKPQWQVCHDTETWR